MTTRYRRFVAVQRLLARVVSRGSDATAAKVVLVRQLVKHLRCRQGFCHCFGGFAPDGRTRILDFATDGEQGDLGAEWVRAYRSSVWWAQPRKLPWVEALVRQPMGLSVVRPRELLSDEQREMVGEEGEGGAWGQGPWLVGFFRVNPRKCGQSPRERGSGGMVRPNGHRNGRVQVSGEDEAERTVGLTVGLSRRAGGAEFDQQEVMFLRGVMVGLRRLAREGCFAMHPAEWQPAGLSIRQTQVLQLLLKGRSTKEAAWELGISTLTVSGYIKDIYRHFDVHSRSELLSHFIRR